MNDMIDENHQLNRLATNLSTLGSKIEDCEFYKRLPPEGRSIFHGLDHYQHYRNITLTKLQSILLSSEFGFVFLDTPCLVYSNAKMAIFYVITIQFKDDHDPILTQTVTDRNEKIPTWIISMRQQLPFLDILPMSKPRSFFRKGESVFGEAFTPQGPAYSIYIDFRRVPPPNWVRELKVSHLLDNTVNVQNLIKNDPFDPAKVPQYREDIKDMNTFIEKYEKAIHQEIETNKVFKTTTADILASSLTPKELAAGKVVDTSKKQANIGDLFKKLATSAPVKRPLEQDLTPKSDQVQEPPAKKQRLNDTDQGLPGVKSSLPVSNAVAPKPPPKSTKTKKKQTKPKPKKEEDAMDIDEALPAKTKKRKREKDTMNKFVVPVSSKETMEKLAPRAIENFQRPSQLTQEEINLLASLKRWNPEDKTHMSILLKTYLTGPGYYVSDKPNLARPFINAYLTYLNERMTWCRKPECTTFNPPTKTLIGTMYDCSKTATNKEFMVAKLVKSDDPEPLQCFITQRKLKPEEAIRLDLIEFHEGASSKTHTFTVSKAKLSFLKTINVVCSYLYSSYKEMKKNGEQVIVNQLDILELIVRLLNSW